MNSSINGAASQQFLEQLARAGSRDGSEVSVVTSPGARASAWAVKVKSLASNNIYNVRVVEIGEAGSMPVEVAGQMEAVNLAEPFLEAGRLPAGTFAVMFRAGNKNIFYAPL